MLLVITFIASALVLYFGLITLLAVYDNKVLRQS